jgi:CRISPR-associated protein Cas6
MFWEENTDAAQVSLSDDTIDVLFSIDCREIPVDHAHELSQAVLKALPWLREEQRAGVHLIHVAASQNGWERPAHGEGQMLCLSKRTKFTLRVPSERLREAESLSGATLDLNGHRLTVGKFKTRRLSKLGTIFSRYVVCHPGEAEQDFLHRMVGELRAMGIPVKKALCGKETALAHPDGAIHTRSLMLADLTPEHSLQLQRYGLGPHRLMGCGIFIPHKGIDPVKKLDDD